MDDDDVANDDDPTNATDDVLHQLNRQMKASAKKRQAILMSALRYEIRKQKIVDEYYDALAAEYTAIAEEKHESLDALGRLNDDRIHLEMQFVLMDILRDLDVLQNELETLRRDDLVDLRYTPLRNTAGLFFKNLYADEYRTADRATDRTRRLERGSGHLANTWPDTWSDTWRIFVVLAACTVVLIMAMLVVMKRVTS